MITPASPPLSILYFAWVAEQIGCRQEQCAATDEVRGLTIAAFLERHAKTSPGHTAAFARPDRLRAARDQIFVSLDTIIGDARELAIFPPVTGG